MDLVVTTRPTVEPVTLAEVKSHLRVDHDAENADLELLISAARAAIEHRIGRSIPAQTLSLRCPSFPAHGALGLPRPMVRTVTHVKYYDADNVLQTLTPATSYLTYLSENEGRLYLPDGVIWPTSTYIRPDAAIVTYDAGWLVPADVPAVLKRAILLVVGDHYENRGTKITGTIVAEIPNHIDALLDPWRVWSLS